uniref:Uncharacterized protein n=2 Tax=Hemiselmis andersenii TaxID=464988 RepID=A0A7S1DXS2_HEMAN
MADQGVRGQLLEGGRCYSSPVFGLRWYFRAVTLLVDLAGLPRPGVMADSAAISPPTMANNKGGARSPLAEAANRAAPAAVPGLAVPLRTAGALVDSTGQPVDVDTMDLANLSPRSECLTYSKRLIAEMQAPAATDNFQGKVHTINRGTIKVHGHNLECELVQYPCGHFEPAPDSSNGAPVPVYLHVMRMTLPANHSSGGGQPYKPILEKKAVGAVIDRNTVIKDWLIAENWSLDKVGVGAGLSLRFSGRTPASADRRIMEPVFQTVDCASDSTTSAYIWSELFEKLHVERANFEQAALAYAERSADERRKGREAEMARREEKEELTRPDRFWKAIKASNTKTVRELISKKYKHSKPPVPLVRLSDASGWSPVHWSAYKGSKDMCTMLLKSKGDALATDACGNTPLHVACFNNAADTALFLADYMAKEHPGEGPNVANRFGSSPVMEAASNGHAELAAQLLKLKVDWVPTEALPVKGHHHHHHKGKDSEGRKGDKKSKSPGSVPAGAKKEGKDGRQKPAKAESKPPKDA